mmetsp:Transcript_6047/g.18680  ORF Transcript_6047/g.18680 Transcript_6047/m.18680 type:complete len:372 (-) Transcript_6047:1655-2770(-)
MLRGGERAGLLWRRTHPLRPARARRPRAEAQQPSLASGLWPHGTIRCQASEHGHGHGQALEDRQTAARHRRSRLGLIRGAQQRVDRGAECVEVAVNAGKRGGVDEDLSATQEVRDGVRAVEQPALVLDAVRDGVHLHAVDGAGRDRHAHAQAARDDALAHKVVPRHGRLFAAVHARRDRREGRQLPRAALRDVGKGAVAARCKGTQLLLLHASHSVDRTRSVREERVRPRRVEQRQLDAQAEANRIERLVESHEERVALRHDLVSEELRAILPHEAVVQVDGGRRGVGVPFPQLSGAFNVGQHKCDVLVACVFSSARRLVLCAAQAARHQVREQEIPRQQRRRRQHHQPNHDAHGYDPCRHSRRVMPHACH